MKHVFVPPELGQKILLVLDECPACLDMLDTIIGGLSDLPQREFTLLYCCTIIHPEYGDTHDKTGEVLAILEAEEHEFQVAEQFLYQAADMLHAAGVPVNRIHIVKALGEECLVGAIATELKRGHYASLVIRHYYRHIVQGLQWRGVMDTFGRIADTVIWVMPADTPAFSVTV
jgi:hypothetical protein